LNWFPLPKRATEQETKAARVLAIAALSGVLTLQDGRIHIVGKSTGLEPPKDVVLPASFAKAGSILDRGAADDLGNPTRGVLDLLRSRISERRRGAVGSNEIERDRSFVTTLKSAIAERLVSNYDDSGSVVALATQFCVEDEGLRRAVIASATIDDSVAGSLLKRKGAQLAGGRTAKDDGLFCLICGSLIARDREAAELAGWVCQERGHYFGPDLS